MKVSDEKLLGMDNGVPLEEKAVYKYFCLFVVVC